MGDAVATQVQRNAQARADLAAEFGLLSVQDAGLPSGSPVSVVTEWLSERRIFAVDVDGEQRLPGFQFDGAGRPRPVVADVLALLADRLSAWELALWFTADNGWLGARRPVDVMAANPNAVVDAARHLAADLAPDAD